ncbi:MAG: hypothetical protein KJ754_16115 [Bacteroidetes bacterium]|nr:hypothetical protein [Bacteroidota bacterium]MBU1580957.1 hypothetical protein [Bacteroidota bacterium]
MTSLFSILSLSLAVASFYMAVSKTEKNHIKKVVAVSFAILVMITWMINGFYHWSKLNLLENDISNMLGSHSKPMTFEEIRKDLYKYKTSEIRHAVDSAVDKNHILTTSIRLKAKSGKEYEIRLYGHSNWGINE